MENHSESSSFVVLDVAASSQEEHYVEPEAESVFLSF